MKRLYNCLLVLFETVILGNFEFGNVEMEIHIVAYITTPQTCINTT